MSDSPRLTRRPPRPRPTPKSGAPDRTAGHPAGRRRGSSGYLTIGAAAVVALVSVLAMVATGYRHSVLNLLDAGAWLRSTHVSSLEHVNGPSGALDSTLRAPIAGSPGLELVNTEEGAALLNTSTGKLALINGARLHELSAPRSVGPAGKTELVGDTSTTWVVQPPAGEAARLQVGSEKMGQPVRFPGQITSAAVDGGGRLWVYLPKIGAVASAAPALHHPQASRPIAVTSRGGSAELTVVDGVPYVYVPATEVLERLSTNRASVVTHLPVSPNTRATMAPQQGSPADGMVTAVVPGAGLLVRVDPQGRRPPETIILPGRSDHVLEGALSDDNVVLVPDHSTGQLLVVDPSTRAVSSYHVTAAASGAFDIQVKNGLGYANDPASNQALVVSQNGQVTYLSKYRAATGPAAAAARQAPPSGPLYLAPASSPALLLPSTPGPAAGAGDPSAPGAGTDAPAGASSLAARALPSSGALPSGTEPAAAPAGRPPASAPTPPPPTSSSSRPGPPGAVVAQAGDTTITVSWAPGPANGSPATSFVVSWGPGTGQVVAGTSAVIRGLTDGTSYDVTVAARNNAGDSAAVSSTPDPVTPRAAVPGAPSQVQARAGDDSVAVSFTPATGNVASYRVSTTPAGPGQPLSVSSTGTSATLSNLTGGTTYTVTVTAVAANGTTAAAQSGPVTPFGLPGQVTGLTAQPTSTSSATVGWAAPASNGSTIDQYRVTVTPAGGSPTTRTTTATSMALSGLSAGTSYTVTVAAHNAAGWGSPSAANGFSTQTPLPTAAITGISQTANGTVSVSLSVNANGGPATTACQVQTQGVGTSSGGCQAISVSGLTAGVTYTFTAQALLNGTPGPSSAGATYMPVYNTTAGNTLDDPTTTVDLHSGPATTYPVTGTVVDGQPIQIVCQVQGQKVNGTVSGSSTIWDKLQNGSYITDLLTNTTGYNAFTPGISQC